ncbi:MULTISPECIES: ATP-binding protein [Pseudomonas]|jgi:two-component system OmpR family sensor kinase|uniref:histidine kinase n=2 Tax=Pseudomonas fluorescens TaxID=294 RepID=A0ABY1TG01_PSEFL|nr:MULTISPECIES: ATP-binding protein [Pseudomonas]MEA3170879.1 two-component system, OmpR family, sensor kinase [Pseudomonas sp.]MCI4605986.1 ATP-binding protein [Pseudomonas fluorescens]NNB71432.1 two-component sensor histidine kinase [Pseudomonas fluorescens]OEC70710.1 two-component sensor histidine kinase [Pseudomonas sp. AP19]OPB04899.1 two-component sensor histidine kinase [Pseudomonas fluorescens]
MDGFKKRLSESVQLRLSVTLSLAILLVALVASVFAFVSAFDETHEQQDDTLRQVAMLYDRQQMTLHYPQGPAIDGDDEESRVIIQHLGDGRRATGINDEALPLPFPTDLADGLSTVEVSGENFRVLVHTTARGERIAVAQESDARDKDARESAWRSLLPFLILFPVLLLVVGDLVRKLFRPIGVLAAEIDQRAEQELHPIEEQHLPSEVRPFVVAINRLLARVEQSMDSQRRFVADAAHELRSPMTALALQADRLAATDLSPMSRERFEPLSRGIQRGRTLIDQLLSLAAAQSASERVQTSLSVHAVYRQVLEDLLPLAERKQIDIGVESTQDVQVMFNAMDLFTLVKNLVDNAIRYTPPGGRIDLSVAVMADTIQLQIKDSGPGISVEEQARVFDPFYRSLGTDEAGSGLGLSIVKAITDRTGAQVQLSFTDAEEQRGLCVSVWLAK